MPPNKMERFTQRARRVLSLAQESAERLNHDYIGTEHVLLGLMREEGGVAGRVLRDLGLEQARVEELVLELSHAGTQQPTAHLDLSPGTKRVLELAVDEARRMGHHYIGTEHVLLGLVRQADGVAIDVLKRLGISPEEVRRQTRRVLQESPQQPSTERDAVRTIASTPLASAFSLPNPFQFRLTESIVTKILDMLRDSKISPTQAAELIGALQPHLKLTPGEEARIGSMVTKPETTRMQHVTIIVKDKDSGVVDTQLQVPLQGALSVVDTFLLNVMNNRSTLMEFESGDGKKQITVQIEEDKE